MASPLCSNEHRYFTWRYIFSSHIMSFAWNVLYYISLCMFCFLVCHKYPCWTHLFERAKIMLWFVRIALCASLKFFELWNCSSASLISFWAWCALLFLKKGSHASLRFIWELVNFEEILSCFTYIILRDENFYAHVLHLNLFELSEATYETSPKVIDIQERYNKNFHEDRWTK